YCQPLFCPEGTLAHVAGWHQILCSLCGALSNGWLQNNFGRVWYDPTTAARLHLFLAPRSVVVAGAKYNSCSAFCEDCARTLAWRVSGHAGDRLDVRSHADCLTALLHLKKHPRFSVRVRENAKN